MARGSSSRGQRDANVVASPTPEYQLDRLLSPVRISPSIYPTSYSRFSLPEVEDRRFFDFNLPVASARTVEGLPAEISVTPDTAPPQPPSMTPAGRGSRATRAVVAREQFAFSDPESVVICARRRIRREVLMALKPRGKGGGRRRSWYSDVRC